MPIREAPQHAITAPASSHANFDATGTTPAATQTATTAPIQLGDPIIPTQTLTFLLSEDAYKGNAQFIALVDGKQIAGPLEVTAHHDSGQTEAFNLIGDWGPGPHTLQIDFINDAYGGTPQTDRNLYVDQVTYDGSNILNSTAALYVNGGFDWTIGTN